METISQRGRHRQVAHDGADRDAIPAPRRDYWHGGEAGDDGQRQGADTWTDDAGWADEAEWDDDADWDDEADDTADHQRDEARDEGSFGAGAVPGRPHRAVGGTDPQRVEAGTGLQEAVADPQRVHAASEARPRRRRAAPRGSALRRLGWVVAAVAALVAVGLALVLVVPGSNRDTTATVPVPVAAPVPAETTFGERLQRADGWTIQIDEPRAAKGGGEVDLPSGAVRGVVVDVVLTNTGTEARGTGGWTVKALVGSDPVEVLPTGDAPSRTIRPGGSMSFPVTVPMPKGTTDLQLEAAPAGGVPSLFVGTA